MGLLENWALYKSKVGNTGIRGPFLKRLDVLNLLEAILKKFCFSVLKDFEQIFVKSWFKTVWIEQSFWKEIET